MTKKPYPALCRDCRHQMPTPGSEWNSQCLHPKVNAKNAWALANTGGGGLSASSSAKDERERVSIFAPCGRAGKLWAPREANADKPADNEAERRSKPEHKTRAA